VGAYVWLPAPEAAVIEKEVFVPEAVQIPFSREFQDKNSPVKQRTLGSYLVKSHENHDKCSKFPASASFSIFMSIQAHSNRRSLPEDYLGSTCLSDIDSF
jgi:hypothetical protein